MAQKMLPRGTDGRFLPIHCSDPNCDGELEFETQFGMPRWICTGLTHDDRNGPLVACTRSFSASSASIGGLGQR